MRSPLSLCLMTMLLGGCYGPARGQTRWLPPRNFNSVVLEVLKPSFAQSDVSLATAAVVLTGQYDLGARAPTFLTIDLPIAHLGVDGGETETALGNPYVGVTSFDPNNPVIYEIGVRIPLAPDNSGAITGMVADHDRFEAYAPDVFSASAALSYFPSRSGDWVLQTRIGPTFLLNTNPGEFDAAGDLYANYSIQSWYFKRAFQIGLGLSGRLLITDKGSLSERIVHQAGLSAQMDLGSVAPGLHLRLPIDRDLADIVDFVFGLNVAVPL